MKQAIRKPSLRTSVLIAALAAVCLPVAAETERAEEKAFVYTKAGTLGIGGGAGYRFNEQLAVRAGLNSGNSQGGRRKIDDLTYDRDLKIRDSAEVIADWYLFKNSGFRLSAGVMSMNTRSQLTARTNAAGEYTITGNAYAAEDVGELTANVRAENFSPYLGIGWESQTLGETGLRFIVDAGATHLQGRKVILSSSNEFADQAFLDDIVAEERRIKKVNDVAFGLSIGVSFAF